MGKREKRLIRRVRTAVVILLLQAAVLLGCTYATPLDDNDKGSAGITAAIAGPENGKENSTEILAPEKGEGEDAGERQPGTTQQEGNAPESGNRDGEGREQDRQEENTFLLDLSTIPEFSGTPYVILNDNVPGFHDSEFMTDSYEEYSSRDELGRCQAAVACVGIDIMPTEDRKGIGQVKPAGWHTVKYDCVDGKYLYNRCHLIGFQLTGENANEDNLITGTRYMNVEGMLPFENMVADYVRETGNHVLYRVTPIHENDNLLAAGVQMEAYSVEDDGEGVCFNVFCYNAQPGIGIDYRTGESWPVGDDGGQDGAAGQESGTESVVYILNTNTKKFHYPDCKSVNAMSEKNKKEFTGSKKELTEDGYSPCGNCKP